MPEALEIDAIGLKCPLPIIKLQQQVRQCEPGQIIQLRTTDKAAEKDVRSWCRLNKHAFLHIENQANYQLITIKVSSLST